MVETIRELEDRIKILEDWIANFIIMNGGKVNNG